MPSPADLFLAVWFFAMGAVVGSFLNVVIYRLPRGQSLVYPGSRCPQCERPIRWYDNVPILSWLALRGRCRQCGGEIARRYPLVELLIGGVFLVLGTLEGIGRGANLPRPEGLTTEPWSTGELAILFTYHVVLVCGLIAAAWIVYDGLELPLRLVSFMLGLGLSVPLLLPFVHPLGPTGQWHPPPSQIGMPEGTTAAWSSALTDTATSLLAGAVAGLIASMVCGALRSARTPSGTPRAVHDTRVGNRNNTGVARSLRRRSKRSGRRGKQPPSASSQRSPTGKAGGEPSAALSPCHGLLIGEIWVGIFLGWQAAVGILFLAQALELSAIVLCRAGRVRTLGPPNERAAQAKLEPAHRWPALGSLAVATLAWITVWGPIWSWLT